MPSEVPSQSLKRRKIALDTPESLTVTPGYDEALFKPGYMINVKVHNFTTYTYAEFKLSPTLNMIIGPNGTGKSTLVAAICLGLGGKVDLIRRKTMKSMIKTGCTESAIKIELKNTAGEPNIVIERRFNEKNSTWLVNNRDSDERSVQKIVKSLNIQLDNLCHFLPQERVAEFATLSPEKLLLETERTLGDGSLLEQHKSLVEKDTEREQIKSDIDRMLQRLEELESDTRVLQDEVKKIEEYEKRAKNLEYHKLLIPYAQFQDLKSQRKQLKEQRDSAKKKLAEFAQDTRPFTEAKEETEAELSALNDQINERETLLDETVKEYKQASNSFNTAKDAIRENERKWKRAKTKSQDSKDQLEKERADHKRYVNKLASMDEIDDEVIAIANEQRNEKFDQRSELESDLPDLQSNYNDAKSKVDDLKKQYSDHETRLNTNDKIEVLRSNQVRFRRDVMEKSYKAHMHLRRLPHLKDLYEEAPVVSCNVTDRRFAKYVERVIDTSTLFSIFCPDRHSFDIISKEVSEYRISLRMSQELARPPPVPKDQLSEYGFDAYVSDFLSGPETVLNCLNSQNNIHSIPVSFNSLSDTQLNRLLKPDHNDRIPFMKFIAEDTMFTISRSRYGQKQCIYQTDKINEAQLFGNTGLDQLAKEELQREMASINEQLQTILDDFNKSKKQLSHKQEEIRELHNEFQRLDKELRNLKELKKNRDKLQEYVNTKEAKIASLEQSAMRDNTDRIRQEESNIIQSYIQAAKVNGRGIEKVEAMIDGSVQHKMAKYKHIQWQNRLNTVDRLIDDLGSYKRNLQKVFDEASKKYNDSKDNDAHRQIKEQSKNFSPEDRTILSDLAAGYLNQSLLSEHHIRSKIHLLEDELSVMATADRGSIDSLRQKMNEIERANKEIPRLKKRKEDFDKRISAIQTRWEKKLSSAVRKISKSFQKRFTAVASDGQVELVREERFKDWRLQILVKFRENSDLKILDHQSQSGGERAVSTIFFIMSLQGLTDAPFRIVDEINQGMDPKNEKMAHRYLVHTACLKSNSQYFLVTPKLLLGLYYHPNMAIHCIYTGSFVEPVDKDSTEVDYLDMKRISLG